MTLRPDNVPVEAKPRSRLSVSGARKRETEGEDPTSVLDVPHKRRSMDDSRSRSRRKSTAARSKAAQDPTQSPKRRQSTASHNRRPERPDKALVKLPRNQRRSTRHLMPASSSSLSVLREDMDRIDVRDTRLSTSASSISFSVSDHTCSTTNTTTSIPAVAALFNPTIAGKDTLDSPKRSSHSTLSKDRNDHSRSPMQLPLNQRRSTRRLNASTRRLPTSSSSRRLSTSSSCRRLSTSSVSSDQTNSSKTSGASSTKNEQRQKQKPGQDTSDTADEAKEKVLDILSSLHKTKRLKATSDTVPDHPMESSESDSDSDSVSGPPPPKTAPTSKPTITKVAGALTVVTVSRKPSVVAHGTEDRPIKRSSKSTSKVKIHQGSKPSVVVHESDKPPLRRSSTTEVKKRTRSKPKLVKQPSDNPPIRRSSTSEARKRARSKPKVVVQAPEDHPMRRGSGGDARTHPKSKPTVVAQESDNDPMYRGDADDSKTHPRSKSTVAVQESDKPTVRRSSAGDAKTHQRSKPTIVCQESDNRPIRRSSTSEVKVRARSKPTIVAQDSDGHRRSSMSLTVVAQESEGHRRSSMSVAKIRQASSRRLSISEPTKRVSTKSVKSRTRKKESDRGQNTTTAMTKVANEHEAKRSANRQRRKPVLGVTVVRGNPQEDMDDSEIHTLLDAEEMSDASAREDRSTMETALSMDASAADSLLPTYRERSRQHSSSSSEDTEIESTASKECHGRKNTRASKRTRKGSNSRWMAAKMHEHEGEGISSMISKKGSPPIETPEDIFAVVDATNTKQTTGGILRSMFTEKNDLRRTVGADQSDALREPSIRSTDGIRAKLKHIEAPSPNRSHRTSRTLFDVPDSGNERVARIVAMIENQQKAKEQGPEAEQDRAKRKLPQFQLLKKLKHNGLFTKKEKREAL